MSPSMDNRRQRRDLNKESQPPSRVKKYTLTQEELRKYDNLKPPTNSLGRRITRNTALYTGGYRG